MELLYNFDTQGIVHLQVDDCYIWIAVGLKPLFLNVIFYHILYY